MSASGPKPLLARIINSIIAPKCRNQAKQNPLRYFISPYPKRALGLDFKPLGEDAYRGAGEGRFMKNQYIGVDNTITDSDRAINRYPAVLGEQDKKQPAQDFVFEFPPPIPTSFRFNDSIYDLYNQKL